MRVALRLSRDRAPGVVDRSNLIHARLKATAARHPEVLATRPAADGGALPRGRYAHRRGSWRRGLPRRLGFDVSALDDPANAARIERSFAEARVDVFAQSHLPAALRRFDQGLVINNGAAGMPISAACGTA